MFRRARVLTSLFLWSAGEVLLLHRTGSRAVPDSWVGIGGHVEGAEICNPQQSMLREMTEEIGLSADQVEGLALRYVSTRDSGSEIRTTYYFTAELAAGVDRPTVSDEGDLRWLSPAETVSLPMPPTASAALRHSLGVHGSDPRLHAIVATPAGCRVLPLDEGGPPMIPLAPADDPVIPLAEARDRARTHGWREKVLVYVTRGDDELLVLEHPPEWPNAGVQVPGGGLEEGEGPIEAALRELLEETGLTATGEPVLLESRRWDGPAPSRIRHYVWVKAPTAPDEWQHLVSAGADDAGLLFRLSFRPRATPGLSRGFGWESALGRLDDLLRD